MSLYGDYQKRQRSEIMRHRCPDEVWRNRTERLAKLLSMSAPEIIIAREAQLVAKGWHGNNWRLGLAALCDAIGDAWNWYVAGPVVRALCRFNIYHLEAYPGGGCCICERGAPVYTEDEIASACDCIGED